MSEPTEAFYKVNPLTQEQRDEAYEETRQRIAGIEPTLDSFQRNAFTRYPPSAVRAINFLANMVLIAAFVPSAIRILIASFAAFLYGVPSFEVALIVGVCSVLLAESGQIAFTLAAGVTQGRWVRMGLWGGAIACTAYALVGNAHVAQPWLHGGHIFAWLETFMPPALVLVAANVRKTQILHASEARYEAKQKYDAALSGWKKAIATAEQDASWERTLANVLRNALRSANKQSKAVLRELTNADWVALVMRERNSEEWWDAAQSEIDQRKRSEVRSSTVQKMHIAPTQNGTHSTASTGEAVQAQILRIDGAYVKVCPTCGQRFAGDTERQATNKLVAHFKRHRNEERIALAIPVPTVSTNGNGNHE